MTPVLCGFAAAMLWGAATLLLALAARNSSATGFGFWFLFSQALLMLIPGVVAGATNPWPVAGVALVLAAAVVEAFAMVSYRSALRRADVGVVAPLVALEGAFAAVLAVVAGEPLPAVVAGGLVLAVAGGLSVGIPPGTRGIATSGGSAVVTAALFGTTLWLIGESNLDLLVTLLLFNGLSAALVLAGSRERHEVLGGEGRGTRVMRQSTMR